MSSQSDKDKDILFHKNRTKLLVQQAKVTPDRNSAWLSFEKRKNFRPGELGDQIIFIGLIY